MNKIASKMRTHVWPVGRMCTAGCATTLERSVCAIPGVSTASANFASGTLKVDYDPDLLSPGQIAGVIRSAGFSCNHGTPSRTTSHVHADHDAHAAHMPTPTAVPGPATAHADHHAGHGTAAIGKGSEAAHDAHEGMHHGGDLHAAARDMQRRFVVALIFAIPVFLWSPMGLMEPPPVPFGLRENVWLFLLATGAVVYPGWPFFTAAIRSLRRGVLDMAVLVLLSVGTGYGFSIASTVLLRRTELL